VEEHRTADAAAVEERQPSQDRRRHPRVPANLPVLIMAAGRILVGRTRNASEGGLAVAVTTPPPSLPCKVKVALRLPTRGWRELDAEILRCAPTDGAEELLAIQLREKHLGDARREPRRPRSPASERCPSCPPVGADAGAAFDAELRALATLVYEQALNEPDARPLQSLAVWANQLRAELGVEPSDPASYRDLLQGLAALHRCTHRGGRAAPAARREPPGR